MRRIKRILIAFIAVIPATPIAFASDSNTQESTDIPEYRNSLDFGYNPGGLSVLKLAVYGKLAKLDAVLPFAHILIGEEVTNLRSSGTFSFNYMRKINKWLWLGANINYENIFMDTRNLDTGKTSSYTINALPVMAAAKAAWFQRSHISLYSKVGMGITPVFIGDLGTKVKAAFQLTPIGVEFGGNHVFGFVEGGLGLQGVLMAGMRFPF